MTRAVWLLVALISAVAGHSWLDCSDWRFNDPNEERFTNAHGKCYGYPRRWSVERFEFGNENGFRYFRAYEQDPTREDADGKAPCSQFDRFGGDGQTLVGSDERLANPITAAYAPGEDPDGYPYGAMTEVQPGQQLCMRWPAKNHAGHVNDNNMVYINWAAQPNTADPTQLQLNDLTVAEMRFRNCPDPGVPSGADQTGPGSDRMACGGCFTVPQRPPGYYLAQWRWELGQGEWYASCMDIKVNAAAPSTSTITSSTMPATTANPGTTTGPNSGVSIVVVVSISLDVAVLTFDAAKFIDDVADLLNIPLGAIERVEVNLDQSSDVKTFLTFRLVNVAGFDGVPINPIQKASELKDIAASGNPILSQQYNLNGLTVLETEVESSASITSLHGLLLAVALLVALA